MSLEERLIACYVLHSHNACGTEFNYLVNKLHGIAVGKQFADTVDIHYGCLIRIINRSLYLVLANLTAHLTRKLIVDGVTGAGGYDTTLDRFADKSHVADDVKQFVAGAFILPYKRFVLDVTQVVGIAVLYLNHIGQLVELLLRCLFLVDDNCIVEVAAFDKVGLEKRFDVAHKNKCASRCNLSGEIADIVESGKLAVDELGIEGAHSGETELLIGKYHYG